MIGRTITFRCPPDVEDALKAYVEANGLKNPSQAILKAIRQLVGMPEAEQADGVAPGVLQSMMARIAALEARCDSFDLQMGDVVDQLTDHEEQIAPFRQAQQDAPVQAPPDANTANRPAYSEKACGPADWGDDA